LPHEPQLVTVVMDVSQPFGRDASQSRKPTEQLGTQVEAVQLVVPFALVHAFMHAPQLAVLLLSCTSQPLAGRPSQLA
jgi:hypothetical protein